MKATYIEEHGDPSVLKFGDFPDPILGTKDVLVRIFASSVNRLDIYTRAGVRGTPKSIEFPHILGGDSAGEVLEIGSDVGAGVIKVGSRVLINPLLRLNPTPQMVGTHRKGSNAELIAIPFENLVPIPDEISYENAACIPTVFLPVWDIVKTKGQLRPEETALVMSGSSGVGTAAIQVIKNVVGAKCIVATSSENKAAQAINLGADFTINYEKEELGKSINELTEGKGVDLVLDPTGARFFETLYDSLSVNGRYGICGVTSGYESTIHLGKLFSKRLEIFGVFMGNNASLLEILEFAKLGAIKSIIHRVLHLHEAQFAHEEIEKSLHFGKFVIQI